MHFFKCPRRDVFVATAAAYLGDDGFGDGCIVLSQQDGSYLQRTHFLFHWGVHDWIALAFTTEDIGSWCFSVEQT